MTKKNYIPAGSDPSLPVARGFIDTRQQQWVEIEYKGKVALLEYREFAAEHRGIWTRLADRGLIIVAKAAKASILQQVEELEDFTDKVIFARPGWCEGQFANASGRVFSPKGTQRGAVAFTPNSAKCSKQGNHAGWMAQVGSQLVGHPIPSFFVMACFAAPMLELSGRTDNVGFELAGEGGKGKSTTQRLMASVVGPAMERDRGYITSFRMTAAALERSMQWHSDMPFIIDEANLFGRGDGNGGYKAQMQAFGFQMGGGMTKGRYENPQQESYRFVFVTSANEPFNELLDETHRDIANAATDRLMSISVPEGNAGVFGPLPSGFESYRQFTLALESAMSQQYGTAMPKFLRELVTQRHGDEDGLKAKIWRHIDAFKREVGANDNGGSGPRVAEAFGLVYAAGLFARRFRILPHDFDCLGAAVHCYCNFRSTVPVRQPLPERLLHIAARPQTLTIDRRNLPTFTDEQMNEARAFIREIKGEKLLLMTPAFGQRMFPDWNSLKGTADFRALNKADKTGKGRGYHCHVRANSKADWFYAFKLPEVSA